MQVETTHEVLTRQCREPGQQVRLPRWQAVWGGGHLPLMGLLMCSPCAGWEMKDPEALEGDRGSELWRRSRQGPSAHTLLGVRPQCHNRSRTRAETPAQEPWSLLSFPRAALQRQGFDGHTGRLSRILQAQRREQSGEAGACKPPSTSRQ